MRTQRAISSRRLQEGDQNSKYHQVGAPGESVTRGSHQTEVWNSDGGDPSILTGGAVVPKNGQTPHCVSSLSSHHLAPDADIVMGITWQD